ncbi:short chain dehydrogenase [Arenibacter nanhaiticus]|uniref:Short chain dehydrogenase n=1 Tax=Arenibacter nanhaiticus TaxID=558155 RepID=A0A1M6MN41_9FLAO|nr:SDR family NAD(P)-dependent oxidoreductase [Arenibacter nanhaiticus]SHJ84693.1 short chain dehydrogenase [Arenibacter nanhaiticus]
MLQDKVVIISGAAAGIGKAAAELFLREGAQLMLVDIDGKALQATAASLQSTRVSFCVADVSKATDVQQYLQKKPEYFWHSRPLFLQCRN